MQHIGNNHFVFKVDEPDAFVEAWFHKPPDGSLQLKEKWLSDNFCGV
jgi:hypothetical protein